MSCSRYLTLSVSDLLTLSFLIFWICPEISAPSKTLKLVKKWISPLTTLFSPMWTISDSTFPTKWPRISIFSAWTWPLTLPVSNILNNFALIFPFTFPAISISPLQSIYPSKRNVSPKCEKPSIWFCNFLSDLKNIINLYCCSLFFFLLRRQFPIGHLHQ